MPVQVGSGGARRPAKKESGIAIKPWQIALLVIAALIVGWQVFGAVRENKAMNTGTFVKTNPQTATPLPAPPGTGTARMYQDKDRE